jgi:hypothetical protein
VSIHELKDLAAIAQATATVVGVLMAGIWIVYRYWNAAKGRGNIGMECEIEILDFQQGHFILEVVATVHNKGRVPYRIRSLDLRMLGRTEEDPIEYTQATHRNHLRFPHTLYSGSLIGRDWISKVDPGVSTKYRQVLAVPETARLVLATVHLKSMSIRLPQFVADRTKVLCSPGRPNLAAAARSEG